jgi:hypothetical protein
MQILIAPHPKYFEAANDEEIIGDEGVNADQRPHVIIANNGNNQVFGYECPGTVANYPPAGVTCNEYMSQIHAFAFLRVSVDGHKPEGGDIAHPVIAGSACSAPVQWWSQISIKLKTVMINGQPQTIFTRENAPHANFISTSGSFSHLGPPFDF